MSTPPEPPASAQASGDAERRLRQAVVIWLVALATYFLAVFHRSSLAVAGLLATERFEISASQLATFAVLQLLVYAAMQIPVGLLVDRFGPRAVLLTGAGVLTLAQVGFALAESYPVALLARFFVGMGDAMTFICVLRLVNSWFSPAPDPADHPADRGHRPGRRDRRGGADDLGAGPARVDRCLPRRRLGRACSSRSGCCCWSTTSRGSARAAAPRCRSPPSAPAWPPRGSTRARGSGFWMHFSTQFSATTLGLLWGYPFLVRGEGLSEATAGVLLTIMVVAVISAGPILGWRITVQPWHRSTLVLAIVAAIVAVWTVVLLWPGNAPLPLLVLLVVVTGVGGPASMIGFDLGRTSNPKERLASATGIINQGGFYASLILVAAVGLILDWRTPGDSTAYTPEAFRWAMSFQYLLWGLGLVQIWRYRVRARARYLRDDPDLWLPRSGR